MSSVAFVRGQKYETMVAETGAPDRAQQNIFIPTHKLNISEDGSVSKVKSHYTTLAALDAAERVADRLSREKPCDEKGNSIGRRKAVLLLKEAREAADEMALTPVRIPRETVEHIKKLYEISIDTTTPKRIARSLRNAIAQIIVDSELFKDERS